MKKCNEVNKLIVIIALAVGLAIGGGLAYTANGHLHSTGGGHGATFKGFEKPKYSPKGSGFHCGVNCTHNQYHNYWTGGKKYIQNEK